MAQPGGSSNLPPSGAFASSQVTLTPTPSLTQQNEHPLTSLVSPFHLSLCPVTFVLLKSFAVSSP